MIGDQIDVTVIDLRGDKVRLGINAPRSVAVHRREVYDAIRAQNLAAAGMRPEDLPMDMPRPKPREAAAPSSLEHSPLLLSKLDPESGIESFILQTQVAPVQENLESSGDCLACDGRYLWFACAFPPAGLGRHGRTLGVIDVQTQNVRHFPETQFGEHSPVVDVRSGVCYWCSGNTIFRRGPGTSDATEIVTQHGGEMDDRAMTLASRLGWSMDRQSLGVDVPLRDGAAVGMVRVGGPVDVWHRFERPVSEAIPSPHEADVMLVTCPPWGDVPANLFKLRQGSPPIPLLLAGGDMRPMRAWWTADPRRVACVGPQGAGLLNVDTGACEVILPQATQAHCSFDGQLWAALEQRDEASVSLVFHNLATGRHVTAASHITHAVRCPRFCGGDRFIAYTTPGRGRIDLAVLGVRALLAATE